MEIFVGAVAESYADQPLPTKLEAANRILSANVMDPIPGPCKAPPEMGGIQNQAEVMSTKQLSFDNINNSTFTINIVNNYQK